MIAIFEGPDAARPKGFRHFLLINPRYPTGHVKREFAFLAKPESARQTAAALNMRFFAAGTFEDEKPFRCFCGARLERQSPLDALCKESPTATTIQFPMIAPHILEELTPTPSFV